MQLEIHILQSFPPANLNRDENGMPKSTVFGGYPRARISSQCQKRRTREYYHEYCKELGVDLKHFANRSRNWIKQLKEKLTQRGVSEAQAELMASLTISVLSEKPDKKGKLKYKPEDVIKKLVGVWQKALKSPRKKNELEQAITEQTLPQSFVDGLLKVVPKELMPKSEDGFLEWRTKLQSEFAEMPERVDDQVSLWSVLSIQALQKSQEDLANEDEADDEKVDTSNTMFFVGDVEIENLAGFLLNNLQVVQQDISASVPSFSKAVVDKIIDTIKHKDEKGNVIFPKPGDIALFGRMMANLPNAKVDASVQVAHAISVNKLQQEFDFFTAVEDLAEPDSLGSGHMGETGYNSSTYYRFTTLDTEQLKQNLGNEDNAATIAHAFAEAFVRAIPTGHQNGFAAHSLPAAVMAVVRKGQPVSLVDAFENPVAPKAGKSLLENAVSKLDEHWAELSKMYGEKTVVFKGIVARAQLAQQLEYLAAVEKPSVEELLKDAIDAAFPGGN
uniref:CRISPR-associated protein, Cse4 family n=1 Tax=Cyanothece sp. (strain PCC 7425 / ATCC 29141) TaxID=395961 RepID=B8HWH9_CYAP4